MKASKIVTFAAVATMAFGVFADAANTLIAFSTEADTYSDGTPVVDGEWYALVWSANDVFGGLTSDLEPVVGGDKVMICAKLAKDGRCPYTMFQIDSKDAPENGNYFVYLLDTRVNAVASDADKNGKPAVINGSAKTSFAAEATAKAGDSVGVEVQTAKAVDGAWADSAVAGNVTEAAITSIKLIDNAKVKITVANMLPSIQYDMKSGATPSTITTTALTLPGNAGGAEVNFILDQDDSKFFQLKRHTVETK